MKSKQLSAAETLPESMKIDGESHYSDIIMGATASQITSLVIVYSTVYSDADQRNSPRKGPVTRKYFHLMTSSCDCFYVFCCTWTLTIGIFPSFRKMLMMCWLTVFILKYFFALISGACWCKTDLWLDHFIVPLTCEFSVSFVLVCFFLYVCELFYCGKYLRTNKVLNRLLNATLHHNAKLPKVSSYEC